MIENRLQCYQYTSELCQRKDKFQNYYISEETKHHLRLWRNVHQARDSSAAKTSLSLHKSKTACGNTSFLVCLDLLRELIKCASTWGSERSICLWKTSMFLFVGEFWRACSIFYNELQNDSYFLFYDNMINGSIFFYY